jgi:hypothetical protein
MNKSSRNVALIMMLGVAAVSVGGVYALVPSVPPQSTTTDDGKILGHIQLVLTGPDGQIKAYRQTDNLIVTSGLGAASDLLFGSTQVSGESAASFQKIGVGTGTTGAAAGNTNLETQRSNKRLDTTVTNSGSNGAVIDATWAANRLQNGSGTVAITEAGLFDNIANATGLMFARQTFSAINVGSSDSLTVTWTITFADSDST